MQQEFTKNFISTQKKAPAEAQCLNLKTVDFLGAFYICKARRLHCEATNYIHLPCFAGVCGYSFMFEDFVENAEHPGYSAGCHTLQKAYTLGSVARLVPEPNLPPPFAQCNGEAVIHDGAGKTDKTFATITAARDTGDAASFRIASFLGWLNSTLVCKRLLCCCTSKIPCFICQNQ